MKHLTRFFVDFWPAVLSVVAVIFWLATVQATVFYLEKENLENWSKMSHIEIKVNDIAEAVARIEGALSVDKKEK